jgi:hypothetical protein
VSLHIKVDDKWALCERPYVKKNGVWVAGKEAWVRRSGSWVRAYEYDVTPPDPPQLTLSIVEDFNTVNGKDVLHSRWISVGVRMPQTGNDTDIKKVKVLTTYGGLAPTSQFGGTEHKTPDKTWPNERWDEWRYNDYGDHKDTSNLSYKQFPVNASPGDIIKGEEKYYFTGWAQDDSGNWSPATESSIWVPKASVNVPNIIVKEARFQANTSGSWKNDGYHSGKMVQAKSPRSQGLWFYGNQIIDSIGSQTSKDETVKVRSAQIYVVREPADTGASSADIYLFWTPYGKVADLPPAGYPIENLEITRLGELAKGQAKWFELPLKFKDNMNQNIKGMGLHWKDPAKGDAAVSDFSTISSAAQSQRCGEVHVVWEEEL